MADRNEVFRIILEGRDRLSKELDGVRRASDKLDESLKRLKRNKPDEFPLFGGGRTARGPGGQFIRKEEISLVDQMRKKVDDLNRSINILKRNRVKEGEFPLFGGGRAVRGDDGRFIRVQDVTLLEKARNRLDAIDKALIRIRTRIRRGPLVEGEEPGAGATRVVRNAAGQFARAEDLSLVRRLQREFAVLGRTIRTIRDQNRQSLILGARATIQDLRRVGQFADSVKTKIREALRGSDRTRTGVDPTTGKFISVSDINTFQRFVRLVESGAQRINSANNKVSESQRRINKEIATGFKAGFDAAKETSRIIDEKVAKSREELRERKIVLQEEQALEKVALSAREDRLRSFLAERLEDKREADRLEIEDLRRHIRTLGKTEEDEAERSAARAEIASIQRERRRRERETSAALTGKFQRERANLGINQANQRRALDTPDVIEIERVAAEARKKAIDEATTSFGRLGRRAGLAFGDVVRGAKSARSGLRDMDRDIRLVNNGFTRFGFAVGQVFKNFGQLVNLRWLFLTGILSTFFTVIVQIGTALVALAASAVQAGAALGGAFVAGVAQAIPVVGILAAALGRFNTVLDAVKLNEKLGAKAKDNVDQIRNAAQRLQDSQYSLKRAIEGVADAHVAVLDANKDLKNSYKDVQKATKDLADAKIQAARDIVDANLEEKDAALSLAEAELGVLEAKKRLREEEKKKKAGGTDVAEARAALAEAQQRLKIATQQGDNAEISGAQQAATIAEQNLNSILDQVDKSNTDLKDAQLGVKRANLTLEQARVRDKRAKQDAEKTREKGVAGSDIVKNANEQLKNALEGVEKAQRAVVLANRGVRDALHQVAVAQREVADARKEETDARKGQTQADKDAQKAFADLSPAEKKLFTALKRIRKVYKDVFVGNSERDGILGPIIEAMARFADTLTKLLLDPKIQAAASDLAQAIADAFDKFREFISSPEFKEALLFFTARAADNIPRLVDGMLNLAKVFLDIARAATPIFDRLLKGAVGLTGRLKNATSQKGEVRRPEEGGPGAGVATINESGLDKFLASASEHLDDWLKLSGAIINLLDAITNSAAADTGRTLIEEITGQLNKFAKFIRENPDKVKKFFDDARESIVNLSKILGRLTAALVKSFSSKEFIAFAQIVAEVIIPGLVLMIGFLGQLSRALIFLFNIPVLGDIIKWALAFLVFEKSLNKLFPVTQKITEAMKKLVISLFNVFRILGFRGALEYIRLSFVKLTKQVYLAITAIGRFALAMGKSLIGVIGTAARLIGVALVAAFRALSFSIRGLLIGTGIGALIIAGILLIENWDKVKKYAKILADFLLRVFTRFVNWVKDNWKKILVVALAAPFLLGAAPFIAIYKFRNQIVEVLTKAAKLVIKAFQGIIDWARSHWRMLATILIAIFLPGAGIFIALYKFRDKILGAFQAIAVGIKNAFKTTFEWIRKEFDKVIDFIKKAYDKLPGPIKTIIRGAGKVAAGAGKVAGKVGDVIGGVIHRGTGGTVPGHGVLDTVPAMLTPGEWVLNKDQQERLAAVLGLSAQQIKAALFGTNSPVKPQSSSPQAIRGANQATANKRARNRMTVGSSPQAIRGMKASRKVIAYSDFNLVSEEDDNGISVWFLELNNGTFGQVTARDAARIQSSHGTWIPGYAKRSAAGFTQNIKKIAVPRSAFSRGGIVTSPGVQRFANGGIVQAPGNGGVSRGGEGKTINQSFNVQTQGETDWGYVMRLGAVHAQESF